MPRYLTKEEFILKAQKVHGNKYSYGKAVYKNRKTKVKIFCRRHKEYFLQVPDKHLIGQGCPECGKLKSDESRKLTHEEFIRKAKKVHKNRYSYLSKYKGWDVKVKIKCSTHGVFEQIPNNHLRGQGCPKCAYLKMAKDQKWSFKKFLEKTRKVHRNSYSYEEAKYVNYHTKIKIFCYSCKKHFYQAPNHHLQGHGCPYCSSSNTENEVLELASKVFRLRFSKVRLPELQGLELDMYNPFKKLAFEYQGEGHYLRYANGKLFRKKEAVIATQKRDRKKKRLCKKLGVKLICIPCYEWWELKNNLEKRKYLKEKHDHSG